MSRSLPAPTRRAPLSSLPLWHYVPPANIIPSPISLPSKRNVPSSSRDSSTTTSPQKQRRISKTKAVATVELSEAVNGDETVKKRNTSRHVTPKEKQVLDRDDLGTGKSPARRLFVDASDDVGLGISGAIPVPVSPSTITRPQRRLAPSPPIRTTEQASSSSTVNSPSTPTLDVPHPEPSVDVHDVGFAIYHDESESSSVGIGIGIGTPDSKQHRFADETSNPPLALDAIGHIPSSPASSSRSYGSQFDDDQENIPPSYYVSSSSVAPGSASASPSKYPPSSASSTPSRLSLNEEAYFNGTGSGRKRTLEKSRLGMESIVRTASMGSGISVGDGDEEDEELTPGKKIKLDTDKGKAKLAKEVEGA